jgi:hypothetical protein
MTGTGTMEVVRLILGYLVIVIYGGTESGHKGLSLQMKTIERLEGFDLI